MDAKHLLAYLAAVISITATSRAAYPAAVSAPDKPGAAAWSTVPEDLGSWRREPFRKPAPKADPARKISRGQQKGAPHQQKPGTTDLNIEGIMKVDSRFYAIINGRTVKKGDRVGNQVIRDISRFQVSVESEAGRTIYDIYQGRIDRGKQ